MDVETASLFFALLSLVALAGVAGLAVIGLVSWRSGGTRLVGLRDDLGRVALWLAAAVALTCTLGSLYFSEIAKFTPCKLCWYQRIAMYPLVVVLGVGAIRRDAGARLTGAILAGLGACVSIWHLLVERYPNLESSACDPRNPCSFKWVEEFGYLTIPGMALSGFALILVLLAAARPISLEEQP